MSLVSDRASTVKILRYVIWKRHTLIDVAENLGSLLLKLDRISLCPHSEELQQSNIVRMVVRTLAFSLGLQSPSPTQDSCCKGLLFETVCDSYYPEERGSGRVG
ncbi:hypothetical protein B4U84_00785 [Westiellopsis prolifica IICB1]|nr:hypothetical protein B4U84_00785 [Westiellopsis prolifica IICB1]